jgi:putative ABC transport system ATP-binding protein
MNAMTLAGVRFRYHSGGPDIIDISSFDMSRGERIFMFGPSGSGKTTLLGLIGGLYLPVSGAIKVLGSDVSAMGSGARDQFRSREIGFIFQVFNLVPYLTVLDNVTLPCRFGRRVSSGFSGSVDEARYLLRELGIESATDKPVGRLSIGQQQRVAAARALIGSPGLIIADEPTSALDADARTGFLSVLFAQAKREGSSILFVSHDRSMAGQFDRSVGLADINKATASSGGDL